jgi:UDP-N-acetylglucosamine 2-epimerase
VLVTRDTTERPEAVDAGAAELVGTDAETIVSTAACLLRDDREYAKRQIEENPYGDGLAGQRIADLIVSRAWLDRHNRADAA